MSDKKISRRLYIYINDKEVKNNLKSIRSEMSRLRREISQTTRGTVEYNKKSQELQKVKKVYREMRQEIEGVPSIFQKMTKTSGGFMSVLGIGFGINSLISGITRLTRANAELSDMQANVMKTTGMTKKEVEELTASLKKLDTRTGLKGLMDIAEEAGRLGKKSVKDVSEFVKVADKIGVALGDDLQGSVGENVRLIGKLVDIYSVGKKEGKSFGESMEMIGSAINEVSASGSENAGFLVEYLKRVGGVAKTTDLAADSIIGYAAVLDEKGQNIEASATSMNKILIDMFSNSAEYAKVAGMSAQDFGDLLEKDTNEAFLKFLEGVNKNNAGLKEMSDKFDKMHIDGTRTINMLTTLAKSTDTIRKKQTLANKSMNQAISLTAEFQTKNNNLAGLLQKIGNAFTNAFYNSKVKSGIYDLVKGFARLTGVIEDAWAPLEKERTGLYSLELQLYRTNLPIEKRNKLIKDFVEKYQPKSLEGIDAERTSNEMLSKAIKEVNEQLIVKIAIKKAEQSLQDQYEKIANLADKQTELQAVLEKSLAAQAENMGISVKELGSTIDEQFENLKKKMSEFAKGSSAGAYGNVVIFNAWNDIKKNISKLKETREDEQKVLAQLQEKFNSQKQALLEIYETQKDSGKELAKIWSYKIDKKAINNKTSKETLDADKKNKKKRISNEKKYRNELLKLQRMYNDGRISLMDDGYQKEKKKIDELYARKIQDLQNQKATKKDLSKANKVEKKLLLEKNKTIDKLIEQQEDIHLNKLKYLREKYISEELKSKEKQFKSEITLMQTQHNEEVANIKKIADAKKYLSDEEVKSIHSLADVRRAVMKKLQDEELKLQKEHLEELISQADEMMKSGSFKMELLTDEQKEIIKARLEELKKKLSELKLASIDMESGDSGNNLHLSAGLNIFGFTAEDWQSTFENLDTTAEKIKATEMVIQAMMSAWKTYTDFLQANQERELRTYESTLDARRKALKKQLDQGYLTESQYKIKMQKLDGQLEKKKMEMAYKRAKQEKTMNLFNAITTTALAVVKALTATPPTLGIVLASVMGAIGAAEIATIASTPLPARGYYSGGFTTGLGFSDEYGNEVAGVVHANEYVVPQFVMQDPTVPAIIQYLEAKRTGQSYESGGKVEPVENRSKEPSESYGYQILANEISKLNQIIERGIEAKVFFGNKEAFELQELMDENKKIREDVRI